jgi:hypothetical protein
MTSQSHGGSTAPLQQLSETHIQRCAQALDNAEPRVVVSLRVGDLLDRVGTEPGHARQLSVGQPAARSLLVKVNTFSQTNPQPWCSFLPVSGYWGYPRLAVFTTAPGDAGRALRCAFAGRCPPGCHGGQSWGLASADTLLPIERNGGSSCLPGARHSHVICGAARGDATRLVQRRRSHRVRGAIPVRSGPTTHRAGFPRLHSSCLPPHARRVEDAR